MGMENSDISISAGKKNKFPAKTTRRLVLFFSLLFVLLIAGGIAYFRFLRQKTEAEIRNELMAIARLKVDQIVQWRKERLGDADVMHQNQRLAIQVGRFLQDTTRMPEKVDIINSIRARIENYDYKDAILLDTMGNPHLFIPDSPIYVGYLLKENLQKIKKTHEIIMTDLHQAGANFFHFDLLIPLMVFNGHDSIMVGSLDLRIDASRKLFPVIHSWPTASRSSETMIVRREADSVVYLNKLRNNSKQALHLKLPLNSPHLPAALGARGFEGTVEGIDYNGLPVLAAIIKIPDTPWIMVSKVDQQEIYAPLHRQMTYIGIILGLVVLLSGALLWIWIRGLSHQSLKMQLAAELEKQALRSHFDYLVKYANDIYFLVDSSMQVIEFNDRALEVYGYSREEMAGIPVIRLRADGHADSLTVQSGKIKSEGGMIFETVHKKKNGQTFPVEISVRYFEVDGHAYYQSIIREIGERKKAQNQIIKLYRTLTVLSNVNQLIVRERNLQHVLQNICQIAIDDGHFQMACILLFSEVQNLRLSASLAVKPGCDENEANSLVSLFLDRETVAGRNLRMGKRMFSNQPSVDDSMVVFSEIMKRLGLQSFAFFPLVLEGKSIGAFGFFATDPAFFDPDETHLLEELALDVAFAIEVNEKEEQRRAAEEKIIHQYFTLKGINNSLDSPIFSIDTKGRYTSFNEVHTRLMQTRYGAVIELGKPYLEYISEEGDRNLAFQHMDRALMGEKHSEETYVLMDNGKIFLETTYNPIRNDNGEIVGVAVLEIDLTQRKASEQALQENMELFRNVFEYSSLGKSITTPDGKMKTNRAFSMMMGYTQEELNTMRWQDITHPDDISLTQEAIDGLMKGTKDRVHFQKRFVHKIGQVVWVDVTSSILRNNEGTPVLFITSFTDITEIKRLEGEKFRLLSILGESLNEIYTFDAESMHFVYVNEGAIRNLGYSLAEMNQMTPVDLKPEYTLNTFREAIRPLLTHERDRLVFETIHRRKNGSLYPVEVHLQLSEQEDRKVFLAIINDISYRKAAEMALKESEHRLRSTMDNMIEGCQILGHDWRYLYINLAAEIQNRRPKEELLGQKYMEMWPGIEETYVFTYLSKCMYERSSFQFENEFQFPDGSSGWFELSIQPVPEGVFILSVEITERKKAESLLKESEKMFSTAFMQSPVTITLSYADDNKFIDVNETFLRDMDYTRDEVIGRTARELGLYAVEEERLFVINELKTHGRIFGQACRYRSKYGKIMIGLLSANKVMLQGRECLLSTVIDITQRKLAEEELVKRQQIIDSIFDNSPVGFAVNRIDTGEALYVAGRFEEIYGVENGALHSAAEFFEKVYLDPVYRMEMQTRIMNDISSGDILRMRWKNITLRTREGNIKVVNASNIPLPDQNLMISTVQDVTDQWLAEEALKASEVRYRSLFESARDGILIVDSASGIILDSNPFLLTLLDYTEAELTGKKIWEISSFKGIAASQKAFADLLELEYMRFDDLPVTSRNGHLLTVEFISMVYTVNSQKIFQCNVRDVTERKLAERAMKARDELLRITGRIAKVGGWELEVATSKVMWTDEVAIIHEMEPGEFISVEQGIAFYEPDSRKIIEDALNDAITKIKPYDLELRIITAKGNPKWVRAIGIPVAENGKVEVVRGSFQDITERKAIEKEILELNATLEKRVSDRTQQLEQANKELESFSYTVSHDLRTPLRAIAGFTQILLQEYEPHFDEEGKRICGIILRNTKHMGQLIDDLLAFSRVGRSELHIVPVNMIDLVWNVYADAVPERAKQHIKFTVRHLGNSFADPSLIRQVWTNLISNALKYSSKKEKPEITIESSLGTHEITYIIRDNGVGFEMQYTDKLFRVFERLHTAGEFEGTGVGLAIVQRIVQRHGGRIWAEGEPNKGAVFYFTLPVKNHTS